MLPLEQGNTFAAPRPFLPGVMAGEGAGACMQWREVLQREPVGEIRIDQDLAPYTTYRVGGPAAALVRPRSREEFIRLFQVIGRESIPWAVIGRGSNLLVSDKGFEGVVVFVDRCFGGKELVDAPGRVRVEAGCTLSGLLAWCLRRALAGLEFLVGIPGTVGGAVRMNAGAWGQEIASRLEEVEVVRPGGAAGRKTRDELRPGYRDIGLEPDEVILTATFNLEMGDRRRILAKIRKIVRERRKKQPGEYASCGSFFKNPPGDYAGRLIEAAGLKGHTVGRARVSEHHANFIVNLGGATASEIYTLMRRVQERVRETAGVELKPEVRLLGRFEEDR